MPQKSTVKSKENQAKSRFRKSGFIATAVQNSKKVPSKLASDNTESDDSTQSIKKVKKKVKPIKCKLRKINSEIKVKH